MANLSLDSIIPQGLSNLCSTLIYFPHSLSFFIQYNLQQPSDSTYSMVPRGPHRHFIVVCEEKKGTIWILHKWVLRISLLLRSTFKPNKTVRVRVQYSREFKYPSLAYSQLFWDLKSHIKNIFPVSEEWWWFVLLCFTFQIAVWKEKMTRRRQKVIFIRKNSHRIYPRLDIWELSTTTTTTEH